jgi:purine-binding chemotaxis protein CheW
VKRQFCTFLVEDALFGIETGAVSEIVARFEITPVPQSPSAIAGMMNHRGHVTTLILLGAALGLAPAGKTKGEKSTVIFMKHEGELVGLVVDEIGDVIEVEDSVGELPPESISPELRQAVAFAYKVPDKILLALKMTSIVHLATETAAVDAV